MIEIDVSLVLDRFPLRVATRLDSPVTAVMGPSGSGKTSLLEVIAGLRPRSAGRVVVGGHALLDSERRVALPPEKRRVGYVPQDAGLFPHLSVLENVRFGAAGDARRVLGALAALEIEPLADRLPQTLSGGERQRVALARALAAKPDLLLLDEPLAALDAALKERILPYLLRVRDEWRVPMLYVTHNVGEALALAGEVLVIDAGQVVAQGDPAGLLATALAETSRRGIENVLVARIDAHDQAGGVTRVTTASGTLLAVPLASERPVGASATLEVPAEDVLVAVGQPQGLSARNLVPVRIATIERLGPDVLIRGVSQPADERWLARLTPAAVTGLGLAVGQNVWLAIKSHSIRWLG